MISFLEMCVNYDCEQFRRNVAFCSCTFEDCYNALAALWDQHYKGTDAEDYAFRKFCDLLDEIGEQFYPLGVVA